MPKIGRSLKSTSLVLVFLTSCIAVALQYWKLTEYFDWVLYDVQMPLWGQTAPDDLLIIAIDEKSIATLGRWPWSRLIHAKLIDRLSDANTGPIVFNILFSEETNIDGLSTKENPDQILAQSIADNKHVILPVAGIISPQNGVQELLPIDVLFQASHSIGHTDLELDTDSKFRRIFLYAGLNDARWPNLAVAALMATDSLKQLPGQRIETTSYKQNSWVRDHYVMIPLIGMPKHFHTVSYSDVLDGTIPLEMLKNKVIFIGATARGLSTAYPTPLRFHQVMSGVEIQANIYEALRTHNTISEIPLKLQLMITFIVTFFASLLMSLSNWAKNPLYLSALVVFIVCVNESILFFAHLYIPIVAIIFGCIITSLSISWLYLKSLQAVAETDALTGLYNRHFFDIDFSLLWKMGLQYQRPFSLLLIDIDYFKTYNDNYGSKLGDKVLVAIAKELQQQAKIKGSKICRIGRGEFACLMSNCSSELAQQCAERSRQKVEQLKIKNTVSQDNLFITISIGIATIVPNESNTTTMLFNVADEALYQAKEQGRNQVFAIDIGDQK